MTSITSGTYRHAPRRLIPWTIWRLRAQALALRVWQALEREGLRRARREMRLLADRREGHDPALARQLRELARDD